MLEVRVSPLYRSISGAVRERGVCEDGEEEQREDGYRSRIGKWRDERSSWYFEVHFKYP